MSKNALLIITFISGALIMIFEIIGARLLAPFIGTSFYVWTALIGFILASLSIGYHLGGKWIDKKPDITWLGYSFFGAAFSLIYVFLIKDHFLHWITAHVHGIKPASIIASLVLFVPASIFFGSVSPMVAKLILKDMDHTGKTMGNVFTFSTIGSLFGTFFAGFYLLPTFTLSQILMGIIITSFIPAIIIFIRLKKWGFLSISFLGIILMFYAFVNKTEDSTFLLEKESLYNSIKVYKTIDYHTNDSILIMQLGMQRAGGMSLTKRELPYNYLYYFKLAEHFNPQFSSALMLGGAAYGFPKYYLKAYPEANMDVVEIDEEVTAVAEAFFHLDRSNPRLHIFHEDARTFINHSKQKYDVIYSDTFRNAISLPYQLTTVEAIKKQYDLLNEGGLVMVNVIQAVEGKASLFLQAEMQSFKEVFPQVFLFADAGNNKRKQIQSTIIVALKSDKPVPLNSNNIEMDSLLIKRVTDFTIHQTALYDDYAPVDYLAFRGM